MKFNIYKYLISYFVIVGCTTKLNYIDSLSRQNVDNLIQNEFVKEVKDCNYIVFSVSENDFIIIIEKTDHYIEYFYKKGDNIFNVKEKKLIVNKSNALFNKMFNKKMYKKEFITFNSKFFKPEYEISSGNITYFVFKDIKKKRYGEAKLSFFIKPNPIDYEIYFYLTNQIINYNKRN